MAIDGRPTPCRSRSVVSPIILVVGLFALHGNGGGDVFGPPSAHANPISKPYIPFRTDPHDQPKARLGSELKGTSSDDAAAAGRARAKPRIYEPENAVDDPQCPLRFSLGVSRRGHGGGGDTSPPGLGGSAASSSTTGGTPLSIQQPPVVYPVLPWQGPGRQVLYATQYEHLDMLTPSRGGIHLAASDGEDVGGGGGGGVPKGTRTGNAGNGRAAFSSSLIGEGLVQHVEFPLLFESSAFQAGPVLGDVNGDGIVDAILADYHGGIYAVGLQVSSDTRRRYLHRAQVPRLHVRRQWVEAMVNETLGIDPYEEEKRQEAAEEAAAAALAAANRTATPGGRGQRQQQPRPHDPYHSYFEYSYGEANSDHEPVLRGVTADVLGQDHDHVQGLEERRNRRIEYNGAVGDGKPDGGGAAPGSNDEEEKGGDVGGKEGRVVYDSLEEEEKQQKVVYDSLEEDEKKQRVVFDSLEEDEKKQKVVFDSLEEDEKNQKVVFDSLEEDKKNEKVVYDSIREDGTLADGGVPERSEGAADEMANHRRLQEVVAGGEATTDGAAGDSERIQATGGGDAPPDGMIEEAMAGSAYADDGTYWGGGDDILGYDAGGHDEDKAGGEGGFLDKALKGDVDAAGGAAENVEDAQELQGAVDDAYRSYQGARAGDDTYPRYDDGYRHDDYYGGRNQRHSAHAEYFDDKHYIRLPPHVLCTPVLVEMPKLYANNGEVENMLFVAVSYYFDEDEYEGFFSYKRFANRDRGDETETQRGMYLASAIMIYQFGDSPRWGRQEHLDLSGDHSASVNMTLVGSIPMREDNSKLGAFALASPTVADIDGDGSPEVLMGTSMGLLYVLDARNLYVKTNWPVQLQYGIESRILVEDVRGDTNLEIFVADVGGNVVCLDHTGNKLWHRNLVLSVSKDEGSEVIGSSPMQLGDVDGDGILDIVILVKIKRQNQGVSRFLFALSADTGKDLPGGFFPIDIWTKRSMKRKDENVGEDFVHEKLPPALLVDMHGNQDHISAYIKRNGAKWTKPVSKAKGENSKAPHGGSASGLHIVQPLESHLVIVEGGSGCTQSIEIGEDILSMVQADDVHGTNKLDLIISTVAGNVVTLESEAPFHPLNVWNHGELRSRTNAMAHGYSASQGIFVHEVSRQFRDIFGVYVPVTFEIFDNRPNIQNEPDKRKYDVEVREGTSRPVFRKTFAAPGVYTERLYIPFGPGYYIMSVILKTTHGLVYEDTFHIGYNVNYMDGFALLLWLPLTIATIGVFLMGTRKGHWDDDDYQGDNRNGRQGILGSDLPE